MMKVMRINPEETRALRHKVLWPHKEFLEDCVIAIDHHEDAIHLGAFDGDRIVGVCSIFRMETPKLRFRNQYRLRAMATDPEYRGAGAGRAIVEEALKLVKSAGAEVLWCDARKVALGFYSRMGFNLIDEWYEVPLIGPHKLMYFEF